MKNEKDTTLTAITSGSKYFSNVRSPALSLTRKLGTTLSKLTNEDERQKTISSDRDFKPGSVSLHEGTSEHLVGKKSVKGDILQTRGLLADSKIFWKPTSVLGSATNKKYPINLESSQASTPEDFFYNGPYDVQKRSKIEFGNKGKESVKSPSFEVSHGKLATISLELGSKDKYPIIHPINYQKKGVDFPLVPVNSLTENLSKHLKKEEEKEWEKQLNKTLYEEDRREESKDNPGTICNYKHGNTVVAKAGRKQKKDRLENVTKCTHQVARRVSFTGNISTFDLQDSCCIEAMPLHRVRIANTQTTLSRRKPPTGSGKKTYSRISSKRCSAAAMTKRQGVRSSPPNEQLEAIITTQKAGKGKLMDKDFPKPPPPSPQMSSFNRCSSPHYLLDSNRLESVPLLEKPKTVPSLEVAENDKR